MEWALREMSRGAAVFAIAWVVPPLIARIERGEGNVTNGCHASDAT